MLVAPAAAAAQTLNGHSWYFADSPSGIRFNRSDNSAALVNNQFTPFGTGGSAVANEQATANLLFYSDGSQVIDAQHGIMPNGAGLSGNPSANQPVAVTAVPGSATRYYVFTNSASFTTAGSVSVSVVDMSVFGNAAFPAPARGDVVSKNQAVPALTSTSEAMIAVPHSNGNDFWLITHINGTGNFVATLVDATAAFTPNVAGSLTLPMTAASFAYHPGTGKIAVAPQNDQSNVAVLDFSSSTGALTFDRYIFNSAVASTTPQAIYDVEWSPTGRYLYYSVHGEAGIAGDVLQYDMLSPTTTLASVLPATVFRSYGIQLAPDSATYHLYQASAGGPFLVDKLTKTDTAAAGVIHTPDPFGAVNFNGTQFPNFLPPYDPNLIADFTFQGLCSNVGTTFFPIVTPGADSLVWDFGNGDPAVAAWTPIFTYASGGSFTVSLTAFYHGETASAAKTVTIADFPLQVTLVQDTTACSCEFPLQDPGNNCTDFSVQVQVQNAVAPTFTWSNGDLGPVLTPDSAGYYYVIINDGACSTYAGVNIREYGVVDQRANIWYFGQNAGIDFNVAPPVPLNDSQMNAPEGCATISDRNGLVVFYTDGNTVYNKNHAVIATGIGGDVGSSQSSIIIPVPGDETLYYIFTTQEVYGTYTYEVRYSLFDLKPNSGLGAVVQQNQVLFSRSTERITASNNWLLVHEYGNNTFRAYAITTDGIGDPVFSSVGSDHVFSAAEPGRGYMKLGPQNRIAVALSDAAAGNLVEVFDFVDTTGVVTNLRTLPVQDAGQMYGVEFSPTGNKLFATVNASPSKVYEWSFDSLAVPHRKQITSFNGSLGALQLGPDGQIYLAVENSTVMGTIQPNEDTTAVSVVNFAGFNLLPGTASRLGLPNFTQIVSDALTGPGIIAQGVCFGLPTDFTAIKTDAIDNASWFFGDGGTAVGDTTSHLYPAPALYNVQLLLTNRCGLDTTLVEPLRIYAPPAPPAFPGAVALCTGPVTLEAALLSDPNLPNLSFFWSSGDTTRTLTVDVQSFVSVIIVDNNGCTSGGTSIVGDSRPQVDLGPDRTLCQDAFGGTLDAGNPGAGFQKAWTVNGINPTSGQTRAVDTSVPGVFAYRVQVTDLVNTCFAIDTATYTINPNPVFTVTGTNPTLCLVADGRIDVNITSAGSFSYFITGPAFFSGIQQSGPIVISTPNTLTAGTYSALVLDEISGCIESTNVGLTDASFVANASAVAPNCDPVILNVTTTAVSLPLTYTLTETGTGTVTGPNNSATANFNTAVGVPAGTYIIEVEDNGGCIFTLNNFPVTPNPPVTVTLTSDGCVSPATVTATAPGGSTYAWTGPGIVGPTTGSTITVSPGQGSFSYTVDVNAAGLCPNSSSTSVVIDNALNPSLSQSPACSDQVLVTAQPTGPFIYRWYSSGVFQPGLLGQNLSFGLPSNGAVLAVAVTSTSSGCTSPISSPITLQVFGEVTASLTSTVACEGGDPFLLTASTNASPVTFSWTLDGTPISATTATLSETRPGLYEVEITKGICTTPATLFVTLAPTTEGDLKDRVIICNDPDNADPTTAQVDLDPGSQFVSYDWFKNDISLGVTDQVLTADSEGIYRVDLVSLFGCPSEDQTEVVNDCAPKIVAPNAFRPGGLNTDFFVYSFFVTEDFQIFIYNRWGELIYQSNDRGFRWNGGVGNDPGKPCPPGTYSYVVRYVSAYQPQRGIQEQRGGVVLLR
jgi:hypothetical protein